MGLHGLEQGYLYFYFLYDEPDMGTSYEWIIIGQLRKCLTPGQEEKRELEELEIKLERVG
jgi:hypothetical protein